MFAQFIGMLAAKNDEIESEVYDELLAIGLTEQKEFEEYNNRAKTVKRRKFKDDVSTYVLISGAIYSALISQVIVIIY